MSPRKPKDPALHPDESTPAEVGTRFTTGSWQVSVTSVRPHSKMSDGQKPRKGNMLIYVNVKVKNVGAFTDLTVWPRQFWLTDSQNKRVKPFETDLAAFNAEQVRPVAIGMGAHTTFVSRSPRLGGLRLPLPEAQDLAHDLQLAGVVAREVGSALSSREGHRPINHRSI